MKLHDAILEWHSRSVDNTSGSIEQRCCSKGIIMCMLAIEGLNDVMPPKILGDAPAAIIF